MNVNLARFVMLAVASLLVTNLSAAQGPPVQELSYSFSLPDQVGKTVKLDDFRGKIVVMEWLNPECPFVKRHGEAGTMKRLAEKYARQGVVWLGINSTHFQDQVDNRAWIAKSKLTYPVLTDADGKVGKAYGAKTTPFMTVIDAHGKIAYQGAIDDDADGEKEGAALNYVDQALTQLLGGAAVSMAQVKSYGCAVKYAS